VSLSDADLRQGLDRVTVAELQAGLAAGTVTSRAIVQAHLDRIARLDPVFHAVRCVSPTALDEADASDRHRRDHGPRSPIEGIPVLVKDNVDVAGLPTTGGALVLEHARPAADAPLITRLREAGAIILGKTNLSELANFLTENMPSGYSSLGGQVLNPYDTSITPSGSSSGSGTAAALGLAPLTVGTETDGSITSPSQSQSLVGLKPTLGLVSRTGVLPIAESQDTPGPMTRTVADAAALLAVIAGPDPADPATDEAAPTAQRLRDLTVDTFDAGALAGVRVAVVRTPPSEDEAEADQKPDEHRVACHDQALTALAAAGAVLVDVTVPKLEREDELHVLHFEFAPGMDRYLATLGDGAPVASMAEMQAWNRAHADEALKFGQVHIDKALAIDHEAGRSDYREARDRDFNATTDLLTDALGDAEILVFQGIDGATFAARAGWPSIVLPAGYTANSRRPVGILFVGRRWSDDRLLQLAYAFEQAHPVRRPPSAINPAVFRGLG
jgi:amidase